MLRPQGINFFLLPIVLGLAACGVGDVRETDIRAERGQLGLFTTLPIFWNEEQDIAAMLEPGAQKSGWVRSVLEERFQLVPLDTLEAESLEGLEEILLAQPRPLSPSENVALDNWVRKGGHALIFIDPLLTQHSDFPLGDPRRPHDMAVLSPILARWGIRLYFDERQGQEKRMVDLEGIALPVQSAGTFVAYDDDMGGGVDAKCLIKAGLLADCRVGDGRVLLLADAALLDSESDMPVHHAAIKRLTARFHAF